MQITSQTNHQAANLLIGLSRFGLNPTQWKLVPRSKGVCVIQNKTSPSWCFQGRYKTSKENLHWAEIRLVSL